MATTLTPRRSTATAPLPGGSPTSAGVGNVLRSEWTKIRSVRSTYWTLVVAVAATIGLGALISWAFVTNLSHVSPADLANFDAASFSLNGIALAQLAIGVLGVLVISSEYGTGMIRSTFAAVPQRRVVLAAKAAVFGAVALAVGLVSSFVAFFVGQAVLSTHSLQVSISSPGALRAVIGGGLYLAVLGLLALGLGGILRRTAGAIAVLFGLVLVLPPLAGALPQNWRNAISPYLPSTAGSQIYAAHHGAHVLAPWAGFGVFCAYAAVALVVAGVLVTRRDA
ncbi:MAG: ABC transporter permease [Acidimicrobiales bacterium]